MGGHDASLLDGWPDGQTQGFGTAEVTRRDVEAGGKMSARRSGQEIPFSVAEEEPPTRASALGGSSRASAPQPPSRLAPFRQNAIDRTGHAGQSTFAFAKLRAALCIFA